MAILRIAGGEAFKLVHIVVGEGAATDDNELFACFKPAIGGDEMVDALVAHETRHGHQI